MRRHRAKRAVLCSLVAILLLPLALFPQETGQKSPEKKGKEKKETTNLRIEVRGGQSDEPVGGAGVHVESQTEDQTFDATTNDAGVAKVSGVARGRVLIQVTADGWRTFGRLYELSGGDQTIKITLEKKSDPSR